PQNGEPYDFEAGRRELLEKANATVPLEEIEILKDYTGLRSGSNDYMPIVGPLVDAKSTLRRFPELAKGAKIDHTEYMYHEGLYMINGTGGYGFVLAPYLASQLCAHLTQSTPVTDGLEPSRFFKRWVKNADQGEKQ
ncbi:MAG: FAD-dependent oxidoreductase, partial [Sulfurimonadaceae bacterium]|nr:FAD-dependent oxidoreductase [Sulfurimonadaceae bacterium]